MLQSQTHSIVTIPCRTDNYAFLIGNLETREAALVDVPEAAPILAELERLDWTLTTVLLTHHHYDHVDGLPDLDHLGDLTIVGAAADAHRLPELTHAVQEGDVLDICGVQTHILDVSGHTLGHIAFHMPDLNAVFTADSLMALGCGRLFEGTPEQMHSSMGKFAKMPDETIVCSGHEYSQTNARFALTIEPENPALISRAQDIETARSAGLPTVPSTLADERATNPFLRAHIPQIASNLGMEGADPVDVFTEIRHRRDNF